MSSPKSVIEVAVPLPLEKTFHYMVPAALASRIVPGKRVFVPFGGRRLTAYVLSQLESSEVTGMKDVIDVLDDEPLWTDPELEFFRWVASYYLHPLGEVLKAALPAGINVQSRKGGAASTDDLTGGRPIRFETYYRSASPCPPGRNVGAKAARILEFIATEQEAHAAELRSRFGQCSSQLKRLAELELIVAEKREIYRDPFVTETVEPDLPRMLNTFQAAALEKLQGAIVRQAFHPFLLHGVTGSGKTEVYLQSIAQVLEQGRTALVLVPEISLTPQLVQRFRARFQSGIAVLHSGLSEGERYDEWRRIRRGLASIVIGARSAIFAPLEQIGIIVVDEEHETSFKQSEGLRYNARDLALVRGRMEQATVVLGSATPLVTSLYAAEQERIELLRLPERAQGLPMPVVETVSMQGVKATLSPNLHMALQENLAAGGQSIVFLNRRGFATFLVCNDCGQALSCPNCSVTLTFHRSRSQSICHYCDFAVPAPGTCPACGCTELSELGAGTEKIEHDLRELLPEARLLRMDSDTTSGKGSHGKILSRMADGTADVLIGTQMITKGHDFPGVTLVGVINGEASLHLPDFRSAERTYQVLSQVIGRAGRGDIPGRVILQATDPAHYAIQCAIRHDSHAFYRQELEFRRETGYPPFSYLACVAFSGTAERAVEDAACCDARLLQQLRAELKLRLEILGPAPAPLYRLRGRFRRQILLKSPSRPNLRRLLVAWYSRRNPPGNVRMQVDIDPLDMF